jgi:para-nitrobenzyl esterase
VYTIFSKGKQIDVPLIAGSNADEGKSLAPWPTTGKAASFVEQSRSRFGDKTDEFLKLYPAGSDEEAMASHYASFRDFSFGWQMRTWVRMQAKTGKSKAFLYYFDRVPPGPDSGRYGAFHASEIAYVFENLLPPRPWEDTDRKLSEAVSSYWVNFAATGDPNGKGLAKWSPYKESRDVALELGDKIAPLPELHKAALDFLDTYFAAQRR